MQAANALPTEVIQLLPAVPDAYPRQASNAASMAPARLGSVIVDSKGAIRFVSDCLAQLAGIPATELMGRSVRSIMPDLPLGAETEGYNVAFGAFTAARRQRQSWVFRAYGNTDLVVEGYLAMLKVNTGYLFCLELHGVQKQKDASPELAVPAPCQRHCHPLRMAVLRASEDSAGHDPLQNASMELKLQGTAHCMRLALDRQFRVGFSCTSIERLLGFHYEGIVGTHVSQLLPELLQQLGTPRSVKRSRRNLLAAGRLETVARHTDGRQIPAVVTLLDDPCETILPLLLHLHE